MLYAGIMAKRSEANFRHNVSVYLTLDKFIKLRYFTINLDNVGRPRRGGGARYTVLSNPREGGTISCYQPTEECNGVERSEKYIFPFYFLTLLICSHNIKTKKERRAT